MKIQCVWVAVVMTVLAVAGCGSATTSPTSVAVTPVTSSLKTSMESLAKSGEIGSGAMELTDGFAQLQKSDSAKAEAIKADFDKLMKGGDPATVKKLAAAIAAKL